VYVERKSISVEDGESGGGIGDENIK